MSLLSSLLQPVVRCWSANQSLEHKDDSQACDSAPQAERDNDGRAIARPAYDESSRLDGEFTASRSPHDLVSGTRDDVAAEARDTPTIATSSTTHDQVPSGRFDREVYFGTTLSQTIGDEHTNQRLLTNGTTVSNGGAEYMSQQTETTPATSPSNEQPIPAALPLDMTRHSSTMAEQTARSSSLPADDGMSSLRRKIHEIRDMAASSEDKARRLHALMTESYAATLPQLARAQSPASFLSSDRPFTPTSPRSPGDHSGFHSPRSPASFVEPVDPSNPYNLTEEDKIPVFRPSRSRRPSIEYNIQPPNSGLDDDVSEPPGPQLGCAHYKRNVKIQCHACRRWYPCRHCHDEKEPTHALERRKTENMFCMVCRTAQPAGEMCVQCGHRAAWYYCGICKLWDDDSNKKIYHCADCGICRRGEGIGKDFVHCKRCNICIAIGAATTHRCIERAAECDCPICGDYMFTSSASIVAMPCGHYLHKACYTRYMETAYKCPICKKSAVNMELQWRKLEQAIESQPMPREFRDTKIIIQCNDCSAKSSVRYHWLGNQCSTCDSFNTNELQILGPGSEEIQRDTAGHQRQRIEPLPPSTSIQLADDTDAARPQRLQPVRSRTSPGAVQQFDTTNNNNNNDNNNDNNANANANANAANAAAHRLLGSYFLSIQDSTSDTSIRRMSIAQNIPFSPFEMFHRVSRSLSPIRHYLINNAGSEYDDGDDDGTAIDDYSEDVDFWGEDGGRFLSGEEEDSDDDEDDSSEDAAGSDEDDEEDEDGGMAQRLDGHGHHVRRELDELDELTGHM